METPDFNIDHLPVLRNPMLIAAFGGWANALNVARGAVDFIVKKVRAERFGVLRPDAFFRFDTHRPQVVIQKGELRHIEYAAGGFYAAVLPEVARDIVILAAEEPDLHWNGFAAQLLTVADKLKVGDMITLGSMFDSVLHTDQLVSGIAADDAQRQTLVHHNIRMIDYNGPSAVHSVLHQYAMRAGLASFSLWTHCPYYLEGTSHPGLLATTVETVGRLMGYTPDTRTLHEEWEQLRQDIQMAIDGNPKLQEMIGKLRRAKVRGAWAEMAPNSSERANVIRLKDFRETI